MTRAIQQRVVLKASPAELFDAFLDSKRHAAITGARARMSRRTGAAFSAYGGQLRGRNLRVVPGRLIVQAWRSSGWKKRDPDSVLVLEFSKAPGGGQIDLVHVGVPPHDHAGVTRGWRNYYWKPWKRFLAVNAVK